MKEKLLTWGTLMCLVVLASLLLVHALAIFPGVPAIRWFLVTCAVVLGRMDAPAWVQAVGSVAAIVAAIWIGKRQADTAIQLQRDLSISESRRKLEVLAGLVDAAATAIKEERDLVVQKPKSWAAQFDDAEYKEFVDAASALSINDLPSYALVKTLKEIRYRLFCCWDNLKDIAAKPNDKKFVVEMVAYVDYNLDALREVRETIAAEAEALGIELPREPGRKEHS